MKPSGSVLHCRYCPCFRVISPTTFFFLSQLLCGVPVDGPWSDALALSVLFSYSADGNYEVTLMTKATVYYNGLVVWQPPAVYKSSCAIDVEFFPYDVQTCVLKLGSWTYDGFKVRGRGVYIPIYVYIHISIYLYIYLNIQFSDW